jgi:uncharacterized membrane protein YagU involved in acid resistance
MNTTPTPKPTKRFSVVDAILWGGLIAGIMDAADGVVAYAFKDLNPVQALQYIASGLLGRASFNGGLATAGLGALLHFLIAFGVAAVYVIASRYIAPLKNQAVVFGSLFGVAVYFFMNYLVLPFSAVTQSPFSLPLFINGVVGHAIFVGVPIAVSAGRVS